MTESLGTAYPKEQARLRQLILDYKELPNNAGWFATTMIEDVLKRADEASMSDDLVSMISLYKEMKEYQ